MVYTMAENLENISSFNTFIDLPDFELKNSMSQRQPTHDADAALICVDPEFGDTEGPSDTR